MNSNKVSIDFDDTFTELDIRNFVSELINEGYDIYIVTSRVDNEYAKEKNWWWVKRNNQQLFDLAESIGITKDKVIFTQYVDKIEYLKDKNFLFHLDDDEEEIKLINESTDKCVGVLVDNNWLENCKKIVYGK